VSHTQCIQIDSPIMVHSLDIVIHYLPQSIVNYHNILQCPPLCNNYITLLLVSLSSSMLAFSVPVKKHCGIYPSKLVATVNKHCGVYPSKLVATVNRHCGVYPSKLIAPVNRHCDIYPSKHSTLFLQWSLYITDTLATLL